ncbi:putative zinc-binding alcohol dehydrogenase [Ilyonectria sp. MPI-CAGE-AT-0026]|nr:putative zinc-binding alcohol dehydrogenase [Ilyonectria sp. MPI-CAGE-AT-0026]
MTEKFEGWVGLNSTAANGHMVWKSFEPKPWEETDVDIKVTHSSVCGTDVHVLKDDWGGTKFPICVGHELVGIAIRVGSQTENDIKVGDRVGVGAQADACLSRDGPCDSCSNGQENYCPNAIYTYGSVHRNGAIAMGGHATHHRAPSHFVFKIPDGLESGAAASMLCAGITTYAPLRQHGAGPGFRIGVIGLGGLGHFAVLWAKALGVDHVAVISRNKSKRRDALALGADSYLATDEVSWAEPYRRMFDLLISTVSSAKVILDYFSILRAGGKLLQLGAPDEPVPIPIFPLMQSGLSLSSSGIGSPAEIREMLNLAVEKKVEPWVQERPMKEANQAMIDFEAGKPRFRYVLVNEI